MHGTAEPSARRIFPSGGGEMGALMREHDWKATPLGPVETWPQSLRVSLGICLGARTPVGIYWGEQLLLLYNDAFRQLIGDKHPQALGRPAREAFPEIWPTIGPLLGSVLATGVAVGSEGELLPLVAYGRPEDRWFDFTGNPVVDEDGRVEGVFSIVVETTDRVLAERARLDSERRLTEVVRAAGLSSDFGALFQAAPIPLLVLEPPDWTIVAANDARLQVTGTTREGVIGRRLFDAFPDDPDDPQADGVRNLSASLQRVLATKAADVMAVQRYAVRDPSGRFVERWWSPMNTPVLGEDGEVALVIHRVEEVTDLVRLRGEAVASDQLARDQQAVIDRLRTMEAALRGSEARFRLMADAVPQIVWVTDADGRAEFFNKQWFDYTGALHTPTTAAEVATVHVHPEDGAATMAAFDEARRSGTTFQVEHRIRSKAGDYRWFLVRAEPHRDPETGDIVRWFGTSVDIHDRREAEAELRDSEERFRQFAEASSDTLWIADAVAGRLEYLSPAFEVMWGEPRDRVLADLSRWSELVHPGDREVAQAGMPRLLAGEAATSEYRIVRPDGAVRWIEDTGFPIRDAQGRVARVGGVAQDQTERRAAAAALSESEARFRNMADHAPVMMWTTDPSGACTYLNRGWYEFTGQTEEEALGLGWLEATHPDDCDEAGRVFLEANAARAPFRIEYRLRRADGAYRWAIDAAAPRFDPGGEFLGYIGSVIDITERREAEEALRDSEARLRAFNADLERQVEARTRERTITWEVSPDLLGALDPQGYFRTSNPAWFSLLGWTPEEVASQSIWEFLHPDDLERTREGFRLTQVREPAIRFPNRYRHKDGSYRWISWVGIPVDGMVYCTGRDITAEKDQAEALAERTAELTLYRNVVDSDRFPICAYDADHRVTAFNKAHEAEFVRVMSRQPRLGEVLPDLFPPEQAAALRALAERALAGETFTVEADFGDPDMTVPHWELDFAPVRDGAGAIIGAFHHARDVTDRARAAAERRALEDQLRQSQKMEAMGSLTGGVAHDFNNLLTPIIGSLDRLVTRGVGSERERRLMAGALESAERAKTLVQRLLAFARRQPLQATAVDIGALVQDMAGLLGSTLGPTIEVRVELAEDLPPARADAHQLEMALLNLAVNARDAMPEGGRLTVVAECVSVRGSRAAASGLKPGHYVRLAVTDTGSGMDAATLARAIEPFFSTKGVGRGTGLGLSMVHGLAAQLGGGLTIRSRLGQGTTVELWLPLSAEPVEGAEMGQADVQPIASHGRALLVDDEDLVRMSTADMLADLGFEVLEAGSAEEALRLMHEGTAVNLLVTDHLMPGMSGAELAREARQLRPGLPVLIVSGYAQVEGIAPDLPRLVKPFRVTELAERVAALMPSAPAV